ncbi:MAG: hypothetical protein HC932_01310 [Thermales bacterium]|nr:hypothetical protein [Thermales bacterium]
MSRTKGVVVLKESDSRIENLKGFLEWLLDEEVEDANFYSYLFLYFRNDDQILVDNTKCRDVDEVRIRRRRFVHKLNHQIQNKLGEENRVTQVGSKNEALIHFQFYIKRLYEVFSENHPVVFLPFFKLDQETDVGVGLHIEYESMGLKQLAQLIENGDSQINSYSNEYFNLNSETEDIKEKIAILQSLLHEKRNRMQELEEIRSKELKRHIEIKNVMTRKLNS